MVEYLFVFNFFKGSGDITSDVVCMAHKTSILFTKRFIEVDVMDYGVKIWCFEVPVF